MPQRKRIELLRVVHCQDIPFSILETIQNQRLKSFTGQIDTIRVRHDIDFSTSAQNSFIKFDILISHQPDIEQTIFIEYIAPPAAEWNRIDSRMAKVFDVLC